MISLRSFVRSRLLLSALVFAPLLALAVPVQAGEMDLLLGKLVAKGVLSEAEAREIKSEVAAETQPVVAAMLVQKGPVQNLQVPVVASGERAKAPARWADRVSLQGDLRVRYQDENLDNAPTLGGLDIDDQDRWRIRWRVGAVAEVNDQWQVGFGLASGGADGRSSNQTLRRGFSSGDARLDYAYTKYAATENIEVLAGKFKNPLWTPKDLLWDSDLRPEGIALPLRFTLTERVDAFFTPAYLVVSEDVAGSRKDASVLALQAGASFAVTDRVSVKLAPTYYNFSGLKGGPGPLALDVPSNARDGAGNLLNDYDALTLGAQMDIAATKLVSTVSVFGEWVSAFDSNDDDNGWLLGIAFGDAKVKGRGDWRFKYNYRRLEADAWPEFLADSDHFFGATNTKGSELEFAWGLARGVNLSLDYYSQAKFLGTDIEQDLLQLDLNLKW
jgi:hypothetical protein